jgi:hypothetical protein
MKCFGDLKRFDETPTNLESENVDVILKLRVAAKYKVLAMIGDILNCVEIAKHFETSRLRERESVEETEKQIDRDNLSVGFRTGDGVKGALGVGVGVRLGVGEGD